MSMITERVTPRNLNENRRVVVTGLGLVTPLGLDVEENWAKLLSGTSGIRRVTLPDAESSPVQAVGEVVSRDYETLQQALGDHGKREGERRTLFALWAARQAWKDASPDWREPECKRCGVILAAGLGIDNLDDIARWTDQYGQFQYQHFTEQYQQVSPDSLMRNPANRPAALIAQEFGLEGRNATVTSACASATQALGIAYHAIRRGETEMMLAGGADSMINPVGLVFFVLLGAAAVSTASPEHLCRPFDRKRSGLVMGEGAGMVLLEELSHALRRGAHIHAEVSGYGSSLDAYRLTAPHAEGRGAIASMAGALRDAGLDPSGIDYINAHATGTKLNDYTETLAIKAVFGEHARRLAISSSKSMIGHLLAGSGGPEFIYTVLSVQRDQIHPTINLTHPDPKCDLDYVTEGYRTTPVRAALSNSFGFGGQNATIVVNKFPRSPVDQQAIAVYL
jgi:3-oxoacyl-[acyl-carrier-protein] synthase II